MGQAQVMVYYWDFFGPDADTTANRFQEHLVEFFEAHQVRGCELGQESSFRGHLAVTCKTPPELEGLVERSLRPRRVLPGVMDLPDSMEV